MRLGPPGAIQREHVWVAVLFQFLVAVYGGYFGAGIGILMLASLGFLGLGAPPPAPEWGRMIAESREFLPQAWWYATAPGIAILLVVMGFNLLGDGLRDVLDPRIRRSADRAP